MKIKLLPTSLRYGAMLFLWLTVTSSCKQESSSTINFSDSEIAWINNHDVITLTVDDTYPPLNYRNNRGELVGLNIDLVRLVEKKINVPIKLEGSTWDIALAKALNHEVDGVINATPLEERKGRLNFTQIFMQDPRAIVCKKDFEHDGSFDDFENARIGAKKNSIHLLYIQDRFNTDIIEINTLQEGIQLLASGQIDALYDDLAPLYHLINSFNLNNIEVAVVNYEGAGGGIGLRNDDPLLLSIMNKGINAITQEERTLLQEKWIQNREPPNLTPLYILLGVLFVVIAGYSLWSISLRRQVNQKTSELSNSNEKLRQALNELDTFVYRASHDLNGPVSTLKGLVELSKTGDKVDHDKIFESINTTVKKLDETLLKLLTINVINRPVDYSEEINLSQVLSSWSTKFKERNPDTLFNINIDIPDVLMLVADPELLMVIFNKMMKNSLAYTHEETPEITIKCIGKRTNSLQLEFIDDGIGIDKEIRNKIFHVFYRGTELSQGNGLGLYIVREVLDKMGGTISVTDNEPKGVKFIIDIPRSPR